MIEINNARVAFSTEGKYIRRKGQPKAEIRRIAALPGESADSFEEFDELPAFTEADYNARVSALIRERYSLDAELAVQRQKDAKPDEFAQYNAFCEACKERARRELTAQGAQNIE